MSNLITTEVELKDAVGLASDVGRYALDTEFHRERTYFPQVALIQLAWDDQVVLIDPLAIESLDPLAKLLSGDGLCVVHAGVQDLEVLELACGHVPSKLFDTQIAAGFLGFSSPSLSALMSNYLDITLPKGDRLTDWLQRPLTSAQLSYAASDVDNLLELAAVLEAELKGMGRVSWAAEEASLLLNKSRARRPPEDAVLRIKEARSLKGQAVNVARSIAAWRERRAAEVNVPVRQVLSDLGVVAVSQRAPSSLEGLKNLRGVDQRHLRNGVDYEIISAVKVGLNSKQEQREPFRPKELPLHLRPVVSLITAWVSQVARDNKIDPALLATRADVEAHLKGDSNCRLKFGWRTELIGAPLDRLVSGEAAVAFDGGGHLVLEARSYKDL